MTDLSEQPLPNLEQVIAAFIHSLLNFEARNASDWRVAFRTGASLREWRLPADGRQTEFKVDPEGHFLLEFPASGFKLISHFGTYLDLSDEADVEDDLARLDQSRGLAGLGPIEEPLREAFKIVARDEHVRKSFWRFSKNGGIIVQNDGVIPLEGSRVALGLFRDKTIHNDSIEYNLDLADRPRGSEIVYAKKPSYSPSTLRFKETIKHEILHWVFGATFGRLKYRTVRISDTETKDNLLRDHPFIRLLTLRSELCEGIHDGRFQFGLGDLGARQIETDYEIPYLSFGPFIEVTKVAVTTAIVADSAADLRASVNDWQFVKTVMDDAIVKAVTPSFALEGVPYDIPLLEVFPAKDWDEILFLSAQIAVILRRMFQELSYQKDREGSARTLGEIMDSPGPEWRARMKSFLRTYVETIAADNFVGAVEAADRIPFV